MINYSKASVGDGYFAIPLSMACHRIKCIEVIRIWRSWLQRTTKQQHSDCNHLVLHLNRDPYFKLTFAIGGLHHTPVMRCLFYLLPSITHQSDFKGCQPQSKEGELKSLVILMNLLLRFRGLSPESKTAWAGRLSPKDTSMPGQEQKGPVDPCRRPGPFLYLLVFISHPPTVVNRLLSIFSVSSANQLREGLRVPCTEVY